MYRAITNNPADKIGAALEELEVSGRIHVLNAMLAYQYYKLMASDDESSSQALKEYKDRILLERLKLPSRKEDPVLIPELPSPREASPPSTFSAGFVAEKGGKPFTTLGTSVFRKESVGRTSLENSELVALDLSLGIRSDARKVFVDRFDLLKIRDFRTLYIEEANESPFSWRFRTGAERHNTDSASAYDYLIDGGMGLVGKAGGAGIFYGFVNASVHSLDQQYRAGPSVGFVAGNDKLKLQMDYRLDFGLEYSGLKNVFEAKVQYHINREHALQIRLEKNVRARDRLSVKYLFFW